MSAQKIADEAPLAPLWLDLRGRRVTCIGGGRVTARRVRSLLADGARVIVIAPDVTDDLRELAARGTIRWLPREYSGDGDLAGAWLVHAATGDLDVDLAVSDDAEEARTFCIVASRACLGTAAMPARTQTVTETGVVQVAVHGGGDPRRSMAVRDAVADLLDGGVDLSQRRLRAIA